MLHLAAAPHALNHQVDKFDRVIRKHDCAVLEQLHEQQSAGSALCLTHLEFVELEMRAQIHLSP